MIPRLALSRHRRHMISMLCIQHLAALEQKAGVPWMLVPGHTAQVQCGGSE